jgi:hypothetical protein
MSIRRFIAAAAVSLCLAPIAQAQGLTGSSVTGAIYCCDAPNEANRATNFVTATIGSGVEFPEGAFTSLVPGLEPVPSTVDFGANTLDLHYLASAPAEPGTFDGFIFTFTGAPTITAVTLDPASTLTPTSFSFTGNSIQINNADLALTPQSRVLLNVTVVPEPAAVALMMAGLGVLMVAGRRRRRVTGRVGGGIYAGGINSAHAFNTR